jgi:ABC-type Na+ efflux pump permease subunit
VVAGSNPAVPTDCGESASVERRALDTIYLLVGIIGFFLIIAIFFFGGFVLLDFLWGRRGGDA